METCFGSSTQGAGIRTQKHISNPDFAWKPFWFYIIVFVGTIWGLVRQPPLLIYYWYISPFPSHNSNKWCNAANTRHNRVGLALLRTSCSWALFGHATIPSKHAVPATQYWGPIPVLAPCCHHVTFVRGNNHTWGNIWMHGALFGHATIPSKHAVPATQYWMLIKLLKGCPNCWKVAQIAATQYSAQLTCSNLGNISNSLCYLYGSPHMWSENTSYKWKCNKKIGNTEGHRLRAW